MPGPALPATEILPAARVCKGCLLRAGSAPACCPTALVGCHGTETGGKRGLGCPHDGLRLNQAETVLSSSQLPGWWVQQGLLPHCLALPHHCPSWPWHWESTARHGAGNCSSDGAGLVPPSPSTPPGCKHQPGCTLARLRGSCLGRGTQTPVALSPALKVTLSLPHRWSCPQPYRGSCRSPTGALIPALWVALSLPHT